MSLLSDASYCCNDLGRLLLQPRVDWHIVLHVANYTQNESTGITLYQLQITATPRNSIDLDVRRFSQDSRFKDLYRLHEQLSKLHQQLYLRGTFPKFAERKLFGKNDPETIAQRISSTALFINFVFESDVLRKAKVLHEFFKHAHEIDNAEIATVSEPNSNDTIDSRLPISLLDLGLDEQGTSSIS